MLSAITDVFKPGFLGRLIPEEQNLIREMARRGVTRPRSEMFFADILGTKGLERTLAKTLRQGSNPIKRYGDAFREIGMFPTMIADLKARQGSALALYRLGRRRLDMNAADATNFAELHTNQTNFTFGRGDRPEIARRFLSNNPGSLAKGVGETSTVLRHWFLNYFNFLGTMYSKGEKAVVLQSLATVIGLSGVIGLVGKGAVNSIFESFGVSPEARARAFIRANWGLVGEDADPIIYGLPGLFGVDFSRSLGLGDVIPEASLAAVLGAPAEMVTQAGARGSQLVAEIINNPISGPGLGEFAQAGPTVTRTIRDTLRFATTGEGLRTRGGRGEQFTRPLTIPEIAIRATGAQPTVLSRGRGRLRAERVEVGLTKSIKSRITDELAEAKAQGNDARFNQIMSNIHKFNRTASREERIKIDGPALRQKIKGVKSAKARARRLPRQFRQRGRELDVLFGATE